MAPRRGSLNFENFISLVLQRNYDAIKLAFSADDFDINKEDFRGVTVLHYAAELDDVELIKMILKEQPKVKINARTFEMMSTPLMIAAGNGKVHALSVLLEHDADVACQNAAGFTTLMVATEANNLECIELLLNSGKDYNVKAQNFKGLNALMMAVDNFKIAQRLIKISDLSQIDSEGNTLLHMTSKKGNKEVMNLLFNYMSEFINHKNYNGQTPLHCAIQTKHLDMADILIFNGADLLAADFSGLNSFQYAAIYDDTEEFLTKYKCSQIELEDLFITAAEHGRLSLLKRFVDEIEEIVLIDSLMSASKGGHFDCVKLILEHYEDPDDLILIDAGIEALSTKKFDCFEQIYSKLAENCKDLENVLQMNHNLIVTTAFSAGCVEACEMFLKMGINPNGKDPETLLMVASGNGHLKVVKLLIEHKADLNRVQVNLGSALQLATINNHSEIVSVLLENGADPYLADITGFTPLLAAAYYGYTEIFSKLFEVDDNLTNRTMDGLTPFLAACISGQVEIVKILINSGVDITEIDEIGNNCFHYAAENFKGLELLLFLVNHVENLDLLTKSKNKSGNTPLDLLMKHQNQTILFSLLAARSEVNEFLDSSSNFRIGNVDNSDMCLICRDDFVAGDAATKLPCGHFFHEYCYSEWSTTKPNCPYCQSFPFRVKKLQ